MASPRKALRGRVRVYDSTVGTLSQKGKYASATQAARKVLEIFHQHFFGLMNPPLTYRKAFDPSLHPPS